jgi:peptide/nickel transport system permease protein
MSRYYANRNFAIGSTIVLLLLVMMIISLFWTPYDPNMIHDNHILESPTREFLLGTDYLGRDILSRVMYASQTVFIIGGGTLIISSIIGVSIGLISGYFGGWLDEILMRFVDAWMTIPGTIMVIVFVASFGRGMTQTLIAISLTGFANFAKITRSKVLSLKESDHVLWARSVGVKRGRILVAHILPDIMPTLLVVGALRFSSAILTEAALSYLGLGIQPPDASWGNILTRAQAYILSNWLYAFIPGLLITLMVIGFNLISDGLNKIYSEEGAY